MAVGTTTLRLLETSGLEPFSGTTGIFITPGYRFRAVDLLVTNFHLPKSTLFMLVAAFVGRQRLLDAYAAAIDAEYRFYSFGDAMLIPRQLDLPDQPDQPDQKDDHVHPREP